MELQLRNQSTPNKQIFSCCPKQPPSSILPHIMPCVCADSRAVGSGNPTLKLDNKVSYCKMKITRLPASLDVFWNKTYIHEGRIFLRSTLDKSFYCCLLLEVKLMGRGILLSSMRIQMCRAHAGRGYLKSEIQL